jgi:hypothetical protein
MSRGSRGKFLKENYNEVYMTELCELTRRRPRTILRWIADRTLPEHLMPVRGYRRHWVWTRAQANGVVKLAKERDKLNLLTPTEEQQLRRYYKARLPQKIKFKHVVVIRQMIRKNCSRDEIAEELMPMVTYTTVDSLDKVIVATCLHHGFPVPPRYLGHNELMAARAMQRHAYSLQGIVNALYRRTMYTHHVELEGDLVRAYQLRDWDLPPSDPNVKWIDKLTPRQKGEIRRLEKQLEAVERLLDK